MTKSVLDGVPGLGPARRARLLRELGSIAAVRRASIEDLLALGWLPDATARALYRHLHDPYPSRPARTPLPLPVTRRVADDGSVEPGIEDPVDTEAAR